MPFGIGSPMVRHLVVGARLRLSPTYELNIRFYDFTSGSGATLRARPVWRTSLPRTR